MRTKAEALEKPMAGDRWWKGKGELALTKFSDISLGYQATGMRPINCNNRDPLSVNFRRWAANAEYLGGSNDN